MIEIILGLLAISIGAVNHYLIDRLKEEIYFLKTDNETTKKITEFQSEEIRKLLRNRGEK